MNTASHHLVPLLLALLLLVAVGLTLGQCPDRPADKSSDSDSQEGKKCDSVTLILRIEDTTEAPSSTDATTESSSDASSSDSSSDSTDESSSDSTTTASTTAAATTSSSPPEPHPCILIYELIRMKYALLEFFEQILFNVCLDEIRAVLVDPSLTDKEKVSKIGHKIKAHFQKYKSIRRKLKAEKIAAWGRLYEFMAVGISYSAVKVDPLMVEDSNGEFELTKALTSGTANNKCGVGSSAIIEEELVGNMKKVLKKRTPGFDKGNKLGWLKKVHYKKFFLYNPSLEECVRNVTIPGYGSFGQFLDTDADEYEKIIAVGKTVLVGSSSSNVLIKSLQSNLASNETVNSTSPVVLQEANSYVQALIAYFTTTSDISLRLKFVSSQHALLSSQVRRLLLSFSIEVVNYELDFSDLIIISHRVTKEAVDIVTGSVTVYEIIEVDPGCNCSDIEDAMIYHVSSNNLTSAQKMQFNSYKNSVTNCVRKLHAGNKTAKYECAMKYVKAYAANVPSLKAVFLAIKIVGHLVETVSTVVFSTLASFCGC